MQVVAFNKVGYDPFIDFLKAYAILFVIVVHNFPTSFWNYCLIQVWGGMQVPMFILIQVFHAYKKEKVPRIKWGSIMKRIVIPFTIIQVIILLYRLLVTTEVSRSIFDSTLAGGGYGPGSYYFWIYLQMAIILVLICPIVRKMTRTQLSWAFVLVSVGCEFLFSLINLPDFVYRLLAVRYLFLIPLALSWIEEGVIMNAKTILLSFVSIFAVVFFSLFKIDIEPLFYNTGWATHRWICYFYVPVLLTYVLWMIYRFIKQNSKKLLKAISEIAKSTYEIYLIQMLVFVVFPINCLEFIEPTIIRLPLWMLLTFLLSIGGGYNVEWLDA